LNYEAIASAVDRSLLGGSSDDDPVYSQLRRAAIDARVAQAGFEMRDGAVRMDTENLVRIWSRATRLAWLNSARRRVRMADLETRWESADEQVSESLHRAKALTRRSADPESSRDLTRATVSLSVARNLANQDNFEAALAETQRAERLCERVMVRRSTELARLEDPRLLSEWQKWVDETIDASRKRREPVVIVDKSRRVLEVHRGGNLVSSLEIDLGFNGLRQKTRSGDRATPEGIYRIVAMKRHPETRFYKALLIDYPSKADIERFERSKLSGELPKTAAIGGLIEIHGGGGRGMDWTDGCVALTDDDMDRLFDIVEVGSIVTIVGRTR